MRRAFFGRNMWYIGAVKNPRDFARRLAPFFLALALSAANAAPVRAKHAMVAAANPMAARAGVEILKRGGSAMDAAVAVQMVLNVVEPQSSGIGGGAFLLYWDADGKELQTFDGRETAPMAADETLFAPGGKIMKWRAAASGGRAAGAPGLLAALEMAHKKYGKLPWRGLFLPAIKIAEDGFAVSPRLSKSIAGEAEKGGLGKYPAAKKYFFTAAGAPLPPGAILKNPELAQTFRQIAEHGAAAFYRGQIAEDIAAAVHNAADNPGLLAAADLHNYRAKMRPPVCAPYRKYKICGMGPPTSGGVAVLQILKILEIFDLAAAPPLSPRTAHLFTQAARLAYADRAVHLADSDFHPAPLAELLDAEYLKSRAALIDPARDMGEAKQGLPQKTTAAGFSPDLPSTTHFSIVDKNGNALSMTSSIEKAFGCGLMVRGFLLNNQLTDFSFAAKNEDGAAAANRVQGGKRPRSSMAPTIVFLDGAPFLVVGSPGGSRIINYTARAVAAVLDWNMDIQSALELPHYANRNGATDLEENTAAEKLKEPLEALGHQVNIRPLDSGLHGIRIVNGELEGGADPRREGIAAGF